MFINDELGQLGRGLIAAANALAIGGRLAVITFHSLEDRAVKQFMQSQTRIPPELARLPVIPLAAEPRFKIVGRKTRPADHEIARNPRARSAMLRVAERVR